MVSPRSSRRRGFTLIELLVALAVGSLVLLMSATALRTALGSVGDISAESQRGLKSERIRALLASQAAWLRLAENRNPVRFGGTADHIEMFTLVSMHAPQSKQNTLARWSVIPDGPNGSLAALAYQEIVAAADAPDSARGDRSGGSGLPGLPDISGVRGQGPAVPDARALEALGKTGSERDTGFPAPKAVLTGMKSIKISYLLYEPGGSPAWKQEWTSEPAPRAVQVRCIQPDGKEVRWVIPVVVTF